MKTYWAIGIASSAIGLLMAATSIPPVGNCIIRLLTGGNVITPNDVAHLVFHPLLSLFFTISGPMVVVFGKIVTDNSKSNV